MILQMENLLDAINKRETDPWKRFAKIHIINRLENERLNGTSYFRPYFCNCGQKVKHRQLHTLLNTIRLHRLSFSLTSFCHSQTLIFRLLLILNHLLLIRKISFRKLHTHAAHIVFQVFVAVLTRDDHMFHDGVSNVCSIYPKPSLSTLICNHCTEKQHPHSHLLFCWRTIHVE